MRKIKFRAFGNNIHDDNKRMYYPKGFYYQKNKIILVGDIKDNSTVRLAFDKKNINLMQFTGLKDKNDKEIWEGDILKDWEGVIFVINDIEKDIYFAMEHSINYPSRCKVIGNIYENPDKVKNEKRKT